MMRSAASGDTETFIAVYRSSDAVDPGVGPELLKEGLLNKDIDARLAIAHRLMDDGVDVRGAEVLNDYLAHRVHDFEAEAPLLQRLLDEGADVMRVDPKYGTPLECLAAQLRYTDEKMMPFYEVLLSRPEFDPLGQGAGGRPVITNIRNRRRKRQELVEMLETLLVERGVEVPADPEGRVDSDSDSDADAGQSYWFDTTALDTAARPRNPLAKISSLLPGRQLTSAQHDALADFANANGLGYQSWIGSRERAVPLPSLVLDETCESILVDGKAEPPEGDTRSPYLEIGNHGWRYWKADDDGSPSRRGYIAIRHGLGLPRMYLASLGSGAATVLAAASTVVNVAGYFDLGSQEPTTTPVDDFRRRATKLDLPPSIGFTTYVEAGYSTTNRAKAELKAKFGRKAKAEGKLLAAHEAELDVARAVTAAALVSGPAAPLLSGLAASFDIEVEGEWIYAYSTFGELSTLDPEIWAWAFGSASRLIDVLSVWGLNAIAVHDRAWYTPESIGRPRKVDGELRALLPRQGGNGRRFPFGGRGE